MTPCFLKPNEKGIREYLDALLNQYKELRAEYNNKFDEMYHEARSKTIRKEYSVKGDTIYRGYYCPSPVQDLVIGNSTRGKLLKTVTRRSKPSHEYSFDSAGRLIRVKYLFPDDDGFFPDNEFIIYGENTSRGIRFECNIGQTDKRQKKNQIDCICDCFYDGFGRIEKFITAFVYDNQISDEVIYEEYEYDENGIKLSYYASLFSEAIDIIRYDYKHDDDGNLSEYKACSLNGDKFEVDDTVYIISKRRKV